MLWTHGVRGVEHEGFIVKNAFFLLQISGYADDSSYFILLWKIKALPKTLAFVWRACHDRIQTKNALLKSNIISAVDNLECPFCGQQAKASKHLLFNFRFLYSVW